MTLREARRALAAHSSAPTAQDPDAVDIDHLWQRCESAASMLIALLHLGASRRVCAQVMLACLQELRPHLTAAALSGPLASLERLATHGTTDAATYQRARSSCDAQPAPPAGAAALAALALSSAISLLDLTDQAPLQGAEMDCMAEALYEAGQSSDLNDARAHLADAIRRVLPTLAALSSPTSAA